MRKNRFSVNENVIHVDFNNPPAEKIEGAEARFPRSVNVEFGETAYGDISLEEDLTGLNKSTITNRAVRLYHMIMERQRAGQPLGFLDPRTDTVEIIRVDDPRRNGGEIE